MSAYNRFAFFLRCLLKEPGVDRMKVIAAYRDFQNNPRSRDKAHFVKTIDVSILKRVTRAVIKKYPQSVSSPPTMPIVLEPRSKPTQPYIAVNASTKAPTSTPTPTEARRKRLQTMAYAINKGKAVGYEELETLIKAAFLAGKAAGIQESKIACVLAGMKSV
jgi:hypothetical protein